MLLVEAPSIHQVQHQTQVGSVAEEAIAEAVAVGVVVGVGVAHPVLVPGRLIWQLSVWHKNMCQR